MCRPDEFPPYADPVAEAVERDQQYFLAECLKAAGDLDRDPLDLSRVQDLRRKLRSLTPASLAAYQEARS